MTLWYLFICRDGSFGYAFSCCCDKENGLAVLLSESEPRVISRTQLENLHKLNDPTLGLLVHDGMEGLGDQLLLRQEGEPGDRAGRRRRRGHHARTAESLREVAAEQGGVFQDVHGDDADCLHGGRGEGEGSDTKIVVETVLPKTLFIDREGNFGWECYTAWDDDYIGVLLSDDKPYLMACNSLRNYANEEKVKDDVLGILFPSYVGFENIVIVRLLDKIYTFPMVIKAYDDEITEEMRTAYAVFVAMRGTFWNRMKDRMLKHYMEIYDYVESSMDVPDYLTNENVMKESVMNIVEFTKLFITYDGQIAWLAECITDEEDGLAFEFSTGEIQLITQQEIV